MHESIPFIQKNPADRTKELAGKSRDNRINVYSAFQPYTNHTIPKVHQKPPPPIFSHYYCLNLFCQEISQKCPPTLISSSKSPLLPADSLSPLFFSSLARPKIAKTLLFLFYNPPLAGGYFLLPPPRFFLMSLRR